MDHGGVIADGRQDVGARTQEGRIIGEPIRKYYEVAGTSKENDSCHAISFAKCRL